MRRTEWRIGHSCNIFQKCLKIANREFAFQFNFFPEFPKFSVEWFTFRTFENFGFFWKLLQKISVPFVLVSKLSEFLIQWIVSTVFSPITNDVSL